MTNTQVNTDVVGNTNTTTSVHNITEQIKIINLNYIPRSPQKIQDTTHVKHLSLQVIPQKEEIPSLKVAETECKNKDYSDKRSRSWLLTINNFTQDDINELNLEDTVYKVWQYEIGKKGTLHLHALLYYKNARKWPKERYPRARIEIPRKLEDVINYCMKEKTRVEGPWEFGERPQQGRRTDLESVAKKVQDGVAWETIASENPSEYIRYHRGLQALRGVYLKPRSYLNPPKVIWKYGKSGLGKTWSIISHHGEDNVYIKDNSQWWDGYSQQKAILLDEYDVRGFYKFREILKLTDRYAYQGQYKGGYIHINSEYIYITSEFSPEEIFNGTDNEFNQIKRRLYKLIEMIPFEGPLQEEEEERYGVELYHLDKEIY